MAKVRRHKDVRRVVLLNQKDINLLVKWMYSTGEYRNPESGEVLAGTEGWNRLEDLLMNPKF